MTEKTEPKQLSELERLKRLDRQLERMPPDERGRALAWIVSKYQPAAKPAGGCNHVPLIDTAGR